MVQMIALFNLMDLSVTLRERYFKKAGKLALEVITARMRMEKIKRIRPIITKRIYPIHNWYKPTPFVVHN